MTGVQPGPVRQPVARPAELEDLASGGSPPRSRAPRQRREQRAPRCVALTLRLGPPTAPGTSASQFLRAGPRQLTCDVAVQAHVVSPGLVNGYWEGI
jgi:hypothetical protein